MSEVEANKTKGGIPAELRRQLGDIKARLHMVYDGCVVFEFGGHFLVFEQYVYDKMVRVPKDVFLSVWREELRDLFEQGEHSPLVTT